MWNYRQLTRIDFRVIPVIMALMTVSLLVVSSFTLDTLPDGSEDSFFTPVVRSQVQWFLMGWGIYLLAAGFDYNKLREWTWMLYGIMIIALFGLYFTEPIQNVHRWYRIPLLGMSLQPSEYAKLAVVIALSWYMERRASRSHLWSTVFGVALIAGIPFFLILKQPDLGTAFVLFPITLAICYFGALRQSVIKGLSCFGLALLTLVSLIFMDILPHETLRPYATVVLRDYQFDRLDPHTHHQKAAATAIAVGGLTGTGWRKGEYTQGGWLPAAYTDSVFPAFGEEFGFFGLTVLLGLFYLLIALSFQTAIAAKDPFGRLLAAGISVYLAMHILLNVGMMTGFLPITGVPLVLVTYGGSSILSTMAALGILQSIYSRRFMF